MADMEEIIKRLSVRMLSFILARVLQKRVMMSASLFECRSFGVWCLEISLDHFLTASGTYVSL